MMATFAAAFDGFFRLKRKFFLFNLMLAKGSED